MNFLQCPIARRLKLWCALREYFSDALTWNGEIPATTKRDKKLHGIGLTNIRRCAQKYLGDIDIEVSKNIFRLTVMLYKKAA